MLVEDIGDLRARGEFWILTYTACGHEQCLLSALAASVTAMATIVLATITAIYVWETHRQVKAAREQVRAAQDTFAAQFRPMLVPMGPARYLQVAEKWNDEQSRRSPCHECRFRAGDERPPAGPGRA